MFSEGLCPRGRYRRRRFDFLRGPRFETPFEAGVPAMTLTKLRSADARIEAFRAALDRIKFAEELVDGLMAEDARLSERERLSYVADELRSASSMIKVRLLQ